MHRSINGGAPSGSRPSGVTTVVTLAAIVVVAAGLRAAGAVLLPMLTASFVATVSAPLLSMLESARWPRPMAVVATVVADVSVLALLGFLVGSSVAGFHEAMPRYRDALAALADALASGLSRRGVPIEPDDLDVLGDPSWVLETVGNLARELTEVVSNTVLVMLLVVFLLFELRPLRRKLAILLGRPPRFLPGLAEAAARVQRYLVVKTLLSVAAGLAFGGWLATLGVDFPVLWGLVAFLTNYIPTIGPTIATIPPVVVALLTLGPGTALAAGAGCLAINVVVGNVLEPRLMGGALGLSTLVVFASMLFWGWLWGPVGALLAVPLTMLLRDALSISEETRWIAVLLGSADWVESAREAWGWPRADATDG